MDVVRITGGKKLQGKVCVQGSKNAALPMMAAALLHKGVSVLRQCPKLTDIFYMEEILRSLGAVTWWEKEDLYLDCTFADKTEIPVYLSQKMRSSIILMGAILSRHKKVMVGYPGGCVIGARPVDLHLDVLRQLGVIVKESDTKIAGECSDIVCTEIRFARKSVGATEQGILAAVSANGKIIFHNCALEPEIIHLCTFLNSMGAKIQGQGTETISVTGTDGFNGGDMRVPSDRIVAGTYFCAAAITRSEIQMENVPMEEMEAFLEVYRKIGGQYKGKSGTLIVNGRDVCSTAEIKTETYPGFPTDLQSPIMAVLTTIPGESHIQETIFEDRYKIVPQLRRMGAEIRVEGSHSWINGGKTLKGCDLRAQELRGGAALVLAGMAAEGTTTLQGYHYVQRGYARMIEELNEIGGLLVKDTGINIYENFQF